MSGSDSHFSMISEQTDRMFRDWVTREVTACASTGRWQETLWRSLENNGLPMALVPEHLGGIGLDALSTFEILRLSGFHGLPAPLGESMVAKGLWGQNSGESPLVADGAIVLAEMTPSASLLLTPDGARLSGTTRKLALPADHTHALLIQTGDAAGAQFLVLVDPPFDARVAYPSSGFGEHVVYRFDDLPIPANCVLPWNNANKLAMRSLGAIVRAGEMVGALQRCLELGIQYAQERVQFGSPIARFTPVQDMLVEAAAEVAAATSAFAYCRQHWTLCPDDQLIFSAAIAKSRCGEAAGKVAALVHQVHGAMGFTQEHILHQFTRRLWAWRDEFGTESDWNDWIGTQVCVAERVPLWSRVAAL